MENDGRNYFMINLHESMGPGRDQLATPRSAVKSVTDSANGLDKKRCIIYRYLSHDIASGSDITPYFKIAEPQVVYRF